MQPLVVQLAKAIQEGASFEDVMRDCIYAALILCGGNKNKAAKTIAIDPRTLRSKVDRYGLDRFRNADELEDDLDSRELKDFTVNRPSGSSKQ